MRGWKRSVLLAIAVIVAGIPTLVVEPVFESLILQRGREALAKQARETMARAEARIERAALALSELQSDGVRSCGQHDIAVLRAAVYRTAPIKEAALLDAEGRVLCTQHGLATDHRPMAAEHDTGIGRVTVSMVRFAETLEPALRLRHMPGPPHLAVLIPSEVFAPESSLIFAQGFGARLVVAGMTLVSRDLPSAAAGELLEVSLVSDRYPVAIDFYRSHESLHAEFADLVAVGRLACALVAFLVLGLGWSVARGRQTWSGDVLDAIAAGQFVPFYQPVIDIATGRLAGCEVLVRWRKPDGTLVAPVAFIARMERDGTIVPMTLALMRAVRDQIGDIYRDRPWLKVAFNVAAAHFEDDRIVGDLRAVFGDGRLRYGQIVLEVTERTPLVDLAGARRTIALVQALGARVAIDDVGTGHGGFNYLLKLGADAVKIDKTFVDAIGTERYSGAIIETLVELGRSMRMDVIAEGVETAEQVAFLRAHGIGFAQGYVFAPPLPAGAWLDLVQAVEPDATSAAAPAAARTSVA